MSMSKSGGRSVVLSHKMFGIPPTPSKQSTLPDDLTENGGDLHPRLYSRPLEEVDPFIFEDTFCLISKKYRKHYIYRYSASKSLGCFGPLHPVRRFTTRVVSNQFFDIFIILVILCNCVTLALVTNEEVGVSGQMYKNEKQDNIVRYLEFFYLVVYTLEMLFKIVAKGFVMNKFSYLRSRWNILDCLVVLSAYITVIITESSMDVHNVDLDFLRTFRILRAIKTIALIPGLKTMINALLSSVIQLLEVMVLTLFCLMIFALLGLELYSGKLRQKCVLIKNGSAHWALVGNGSRDLSELIAIQPEDPDAGRLWSEWVRNSENWYFRPGGYPKDEYMPCGNQTYSRACPAGYVCLGDLGESFDDGWTSFDAFHNSMLSTFQLITMDFWERLYELILSTTSPFYIGFFLVVIFMGSYYLLNLMLAVVSMSYEQEAEKSKQVPLDKNQKLSLHRTASTFSFNDPRRLNLTIMTSYRKRTVVEREQIAKNLRRMTIIARMKEEEEEEEGEKGRKSQLNLTSAIMALLGRRNSLATKPIPKSTTEILPPTAAGSPTTFSEPMRPTPTSSSIIVTPRPSKSLSVSVKISSTQSEKLDSEDQILEMARKPPTRFERFRLRLKRTLTPIVNSKGFEVWITVMIIINTTLMASEHHLQPKWLENTLSIGNHVFTGIFALEAIIKICALQRDYFSSRWNILDLIIAILSVTDSAVEQYYKISVNRAFRLLRVFKLAQSWITMKILLNIIVSTFGDLGNLILVLLIVLYVFSILGLQFVGEYYTRESFEAVDDEENFPRWNFQNFGFAFMMIFRIVCGEWIEPLWDCLKAAKQTNHEYKCFFIFLPALVVGNFIVLNLFLALLLNSFDTDQMKAEAKKEVEAIKKHRMRKIVSLVIQNKGDKVSDVGYTPSGQKIYPAGDAKDGEGGTITGKARFKKATKKVIARNRKAVAKEMADKMLVQHTNTRTMSVGSGILKVRAGSDPNSGGHRCSLGFAHFESTSTLVRNLWTRVPDACVPKKMWSLNCRCFNYLRRSQRARWLKWRTMAFRVVSHPIFEYFILALIFASSITLCFEDIYLDKNPKLENALFYVNMTFTIIFVFEMLLKWFAHGLWKYFTTFWTLLDLIVVTISLITFKFDVDYMKLKRQGGNVSGGKKVAPIAALKALRTLRALRPLRVISRWQGMKIVINALIYAIPSIFNVLLVCLLFWLIFSIMGVQFFKGKFFKCVDNDAGSQLSHYVVKTKEECCNNTAEWSWINQQPNFDNVFQGYLTLFQVATFEGWMEAIRASVDSTDVDMQPKRDNSLTFYIFFVFFIVFGAFFTFNLFVGVIIDNFNRLKKKYEGNLVEIFLTDSQRKYYTAMKKLGRKKPRKVIKRPANPFLSLFYDIAMSRRFEIAIFMLILLNLVIMGFEYHNQRKIYVQVLSGLTAFFTTVYIVEAIVKIVGLRQYYFTIPWNIFDLVLALASTLDLALEELLVVSLPIPPNMLRIIRVFRIGRVLRLIKAAKGIRKLLFALVVSLPALFNIGALLALITFIYAILGMSLFGGIAKTTAIDSMLNFETFPRSCLMLFRLMTAAGWNDVLFAMTTEEAVCGTYRRIKCGRSGEAPCADLTLAILYMVSFIIISYLIIINMYIAIILDNYKEAFQDEATGINEDDLEMFYTRWARYDPQASQFISFDHLSEFLDSLDPPLRFKKPNIVPIVAFNLPIARGNKIHCVDIIYALVKYALGHIDHSIEFQKLQEQMEHKFQRQFPTRKLLDIVSSTMTWKIQHNAAIIIQRAWRAYRARKYQLFDRSINSLSGTGHHHHGVFNKMGKFLHLGHHHHHLRKSMTSYIVEEGEEGTPSQAHNRKKTSVV